MDYAKGIAILLVIVAHALPADNSLNMWAYSFHLPLFFIISGYLISQRKIDGSLKETCIGYCKSLLVPYFIFSSICCVVEICKDYLQNEMSVESDLNIISHVFTLQGVKADWFLPCLFFAIIVSITLVKILKQEVYVILTSLFLCCIVYKIDIRNEYYEVFSRSMIAQFFISVGFSFKYFIKQIVKLQTSRLVLIFLVCATVNILMTMVNGKVSLKAWNYGAYFSIYLLNSVIGSSSIIYFCIISEKLKWSFKMLKFCGFFSLVLMAIHMEIMALEKSIIIKIVQSESVLQMILIPLVILSSILLTPVAYKLLPTPKK